uniref:LSDAT_euk domain-containing protein n=1 Tax=Trichobilharzia regenti TaxID=157069 RepID=A0AA85JL12_TRIRE|nr:unnamed protein product [Trichobilharzia regenti]
MRLSPATVGKSNLSTLSVSYESNLHNFLDGELTGRNGERWSESEDIKIIGPTNAFGQAEFSDQPIQKSAEFVRISDEDNLEDVMGLIKYQWKMMEPEKPNLCISIIGGTKDFFLQGCKKDVFHSGLLQAAHSTKAWIITSGLNFGVVRIVGDVVQDQNFYFDKHVSSGSLRCLGIAPWGYVFNRETLISQNHDKPIQYEVSDFVASGHPVSLNINHTHYVFVDDGMRLRYSGSKSVAFRAKLEKQIALPIERGGFGIPVVLVVVDGDYDVIVDVKNRIIENVPVLICSGTGRVADVLALAMDYRSKYDEFEVFSEKETAELRRKLLQVPLSIHNINQAIKMIECIVQNAELVTIFDLNQSSDFDLAILYALIKTSSNLEKQLELAFTWDRCDIAQDKIFQQSKSISLETLEHFMSKALKHNKLDFVKTLLRNGVTMKTFLTVGRLRELYNESDRRDSLLKCLRKYNLFSDDYVSAYSDGDDTSTSVTISPDQTTSVSIPITTSSSKSQLRLPIINKLLDRILGNFESLLYESDNQTLQHKTKIWSKVNNKMFPLPYEELFLWAILHQRQEMALYFWKHCENPLILALIACCLYSSMIKALPYYDTESKALYESYIIEFEEIAVRLLDQCYETNEKLTLDLLERETYLWGHFNCIRLAAQTVRRKFIGSIACQNSLFYAWNHGICSNIFIMFCALICPPLLFSDRLLQWRNKISIADTPRSSDKSTVINLGNDNINGVNTIKKNRRAHHRSPTIIACDKIRWKFHTFYTAPRTKFAFNSITYIIFLLHFSYTLLFKTLPDSISVEEYIVIGYFGAMFIDVIRQIVKSYDGRFEQFHLRWNHYYWSKSDLLLVCLATVSALLRLGLSKTFIYAKSCYVITLIGCYLRIYTLYSHHPRLGPKLVMIRGMFVELLMFLFIMIVILIGYGVSQQVLLYPYRSSFEWAAMRDIFIYPYWNLFGEITLEYAFAQKEGCSNVTMVGEECPAFNILSPLFLAAYLMTAAILLMNLLIAIFSNVFEKIEENSIELWKFNIFSMVLEYSNRSILPVPFSAITAIIEFILYCLRVKIIVSKVKRFFNRNSGQSLAANRNQRQQICSKILKNLTQSIVIHPDCGLII